jgi:ABC-2 type transport system permease protein
LLVVFIQTLIPNKYLGMMINLCVAGLISFSKSIGIEHYLLRYASVPRLEYSNLNGFGHYATAFNWYMMYWTAFALTLSLLGHFHMAERQTTSFQRTPKLHWKTLDKNRQTGFRPKPGPYGSAQVLTFTSRRTSLENTRVARHSRTGNCVMKKKYKALDSLPQPVITAVKRHADRPLSGGSKIYGQRQLPDEECI